MRLAPPLPNDRLRLRRDSPYNRQVEIRIVIHDAEEGGYWAEVPAIPGCATQGETFEELIQNLYDAIEGCLPPRVDGI